MIWFLKVSSVIKMQSYVSKKFFCCLNVTMVSNPCADVLTWLSIGDRAIFSNLFNCRTATADTDLSKP